MHERNVEVDHIGEGSSYAVQSLFGDPLLQSRLYIDASGPHVDFRHFSKNR